MTSRHLADLCGVSQRTIFNLRTKFPAECPKSFDDVDGWKKVVEAHRVIVAQKRHAPRTGKSAQSDNAKYVAARARRTAALAELDEIRLAATRRDIIPRAEVDAMIAEMASVAHGRLLKMANDFPNSLLGLDAAAIDKEVKAKLFHALRGLVIPTDFYTPRSTV